MPWALLDANGVQLRSTPIDPQRVAELIVSVLTDFEGPTTEPASLVSPEPETRHVGGLDVPEPSRMRAHFDERNGVITWLSALEFETARQAASDRSTAYWGLSTAAAGECRHGDVARRREGRCFPAQLLPGQPHGDRHRAGDRAGRGAGLPCLARGLQRCHWVGLVPWVLVSGSAAPPPPFSPPCRRCCSPCSPDLLGPARSRRWPPPRTGPTCVLFAAIAAFAVSVALAVESTGLRSLSSVAPWRARCAHWS